MRSPTYLILTGLLWARPALAAEPNEEARRLYAEGKSQFAQARYEEAALLFQQVYALTESPALLFNMAQAHRLAGPGHCLQALHLYRSYLSAEPSAENTKEVEERIAELGDCSHDRAETPKPVGEVPPRTEATSPPQPTVAVREQAAPQSSRTGPVLTTGVGAALLVAGGVLYWRAWEKHREAERLCPCYPGTYSDWEVLTSVSYVLLGVGGATTLGGVSWWAFGDPREGTDRRAMLGIRGNF